MKKSKIKKRFVLLTAVVLGFLFLKFIPDICFGIGKKFYDSKEYKSSLAYLKIATVLNPKNQDYTYYYTLSLSELPMSYDIQRELFAISKRKDVGASQILADRKIKSLKYKILNIFGDNYIQQTTFNSKVLRWDAKTFPLDVYIERAPNLPSYYLSEAQRAFTSWSNATGGFVRFRFVQEESSADIVLKFVEQGVKDCGEEGCKYVVANTSPEIHLGLLKLFKIEFMSKNPSGQYYSPEQILTVSMHEIGHALGIMGHSFYEDNLMYPTNVEQDASTALYRTRGISYQDVNTIKLLYSLAPEITNTKPDAQEVAQFVYPPIILGDAEEIGNQKIQQAKNYIQNAPNLPNGYIDLAEAYFGIKKYDEAVDTLQKALSVCSGGEERYLVYYNLAVVNYEAKKYQDAHSAILAARKYKSTDELEELSLKIDNKL